MSPTPLKCANMLGKFLQEFTVFVKQEHECSVHEDTISCGAMSHQNERLNAMKQELSSVCGVHFEKGQFFLSDNPLFTKLVRAKKRREGKAQADAEAPERQPLPKVELPKV